MRTRGQAGTAGGRSGKAKAKRGVHASAERRPLPGMMLHIDGSHHQWFQDERWHDLIVITNREIYYAQLAQEETTGAVMASLRAVIEQKGLFCSLCPSHLVTPKAAKSITSVPRRWAAP